MEHCKVCGKEVLMMSQRMTGYCSRLCEESDQPT